VEKFAAAAKAAIERTVRELQSFAAKPHRRSSFPRACPTDPRGARADARRRRLIGAAVDYGGNGG